VVLHAEGRERSLMKAGQDQLLLARIGVDVADREDAWLARLESLGVDAERLLLELEPPVCDRAEFRVQAEAGQHELAADLRRRLVAPDDRRAGDAPAGRGKRLDRAFEVNEPARSGELLHARDRCGRRAEFRSPVHERDRARLAAELQRPVERAVAAARDQDVLAMEVLGAAHAVEQLGALIPLRVRHEQSPRLERAEAARDDEAAGVEARSCRGHDIESPRALARDRNHFLAEMEPGMERLDLLHQPVYQLLRAADRQRRDIVDRLVGIELRALAARVRERIDDFAFHAEQAELEHREEADRPRADDDAFGADGVLRRGFAHVRDPACPVEPRRRGEGGNSTR
jgi:hypothetical protein